MGSPGERRRARGRLAQRAAPYPLRQSRPQPAWHPVSCQVLPRAVDTHPWVQPPCGVGASRSREAQLWGRGQPPLLSRLRSPGKWEPAPRPASRWPASCFRCIANPTPLIPAGQRAFPALPPRPPQSQSRVCSWREAWEGGRSQGAGTSQCGARGQPVLLVELAPEIAGILGGGAGARSGGPPWVVGSGG